MDVTEGYCMSGRIATLALAGLMLGAVPAQADLLDRGPIADFINGFRTQAIPRETVAWRGQEKPARWWSPP